MVRKYLIVFIVFLMGLSWGQLSCGFVVDLRPPAVSDTFPNDHEVVANPNVTFGVTANDAGAGIAMDLRLEWPDCDTAATYIKWRVNGGAWNIQYGAMQYNATFSPGDSVYACVHLIDNIHNYGCSCCPNDTVICWSFRIFLCDTLYLTKLCPSPCGITTSCENQVVRWLIQPSHTITTYPDTNAIRVSVQVNGGAPTLAPIATVPWAGYAGRPDDGIWPDTIIINPPSGLWNHHDSVVIAVFAGNCPIVVADTCWFLVDTIAPVISNIYPPNDTLLTNPNVNIRGNWTDDFSGIRAESTWVSIVIYNGGVRRDSLFYGGLPASFNINYVFQSGDSIVVCAHSADNVDIQPDCTCPPNNRTFCWWFRVLTSEPYGWVVIPIDSNLDGRVISSCNDQRIIIRVYDSQGMASSPIRLWVNGVAYTNASSQISTQLLGAPSPFETLQVTFTPSVPWTNGQVVDFVLDSALNTLGFDIVEPVTGSFIVDLVGPVFTFTPPDSSVFFADFVDINVSAVDSICGADATVDSLWIRGRRGGFPINLVVPYSAYHIDGFANGDSIIVCAYGSDHCHDYCGPVVSDTCWRIYFRMGEVAAQVIEPLDLNGDGRVISNCLDQQIIWVLQHSQPLDWTTAHVSVCGISYYWPDHLTRNGDTLIWTPSPLWSSGDSCGFCLEYIEDSTGGILTPPVCGWVLIDHTPPVFYNFSPAMSETVYADNTPVSVSANDAVCGPTNVDSLRITTTLSGIDTVIIGGSYNLTGLMNNDTVMVWSFADDTCADYCEPNQGMDFWQFYVIISGVTARIVEPVDVNGDGRVISTCADQEIRWVITHEHPINVSTISVIVCGDTFHWPDHLSMAGDTLIWTPSPLWENRDSCSFRLLTIEDIYGGYLISLPAEVSGWVLIDLRAPYMVSMTPPPGSTVYSPSVNINATFSDSVCLSAIVVGVWAYAIPSGASASGLSFPITISGLEDRDSVVVYAAVSDNCTDYCNFNVDTICGYFEVLLGQPNGHVVVPIDSNSDGRTISACNDQNIIIGTYDSHDMRSSPIRLWVEGISYHDGHPAITIDNRPAVDSMYVIFNPAAAGITWTHGQWVNFMLDTAFNTIDVNLVAPVIDSFLVDLEGPVFSGITPTGTIMDETASISVSATDLICGFAAYDSLRVVSSISGIDTTIIGSFSGTVGGFVNGDIVTVTPFAHDTCHDYCGPNYSDTSWTFSVAIGAVNAQVILPVDVNLDGQVISACRRQEIRWHLTHPYPLVPESTIVDICGTVISWGDPRLRFGGAAQDTLIFTPSVDWVHGTTCHFCVMRLTDITGESLPAPVCGDVLFDFEGPVYSGPVPPLDDVIFVEETTVTINATDAICGTRFVADSTVVTTSESHLHIVSTGSLSVHATGFVNGDIVTVCAYAHDTCHDYCGPNPTDTCWTFSVALGGVRAQVLEPRDINGDGCIESSCPCQPITWSIISPHWFDTTSLVARIDGVVYNWASGRFTITAIDESTATLRYTPVEPNCWHTNCYVVNYSLIHLVDTLGMDSLLADVGGSFTMVLEPPTLTFIPMPEDTPVCWDSVIVDIGVSHDCACSIATWLTVTRNDAPILYWDHLGTVRIDVDGRDTICITAGGSIDHDYECDTLPFAEQECYIIQCPCMMTLHAGPDQHSCPGAPVILGCDPLITGFYDASGQTWYEIVGATPIQISTQANPTVSPNVTTSYIVRAWVLCSSGDTLRDEDTVTVFIDHIPPQPPVVLTPTCGDTILVGYPSNPNIIEIAWNMPSGSQPIWFSLFIDGTEVRRNYTDTTFDTIFACGGAHTIEVIAINQCRSWLNDSCNSSMPDSAISPPDSAHSTLCVFYTEPCGGPRGVEIFPGPNIWSACPDDSVKFIVWDISGVKLDSLSLVITVTGGGLDGTYPYGSPQVEWRTISEDSAIVVFHPANGQQWADNSQVTVTITTLLNGFGVNINPPVSSTFRTDRTPPVAQLTQPQNGQSWADNSPGINVRFVDSGSGTNISTVDAHLWTNDLRVDTTLSLSGPSGVSDTTVTISCRDLNISFSPGDTVYLEVTRCDSPSPEHCNPNCDVDTFWFYYILVYPCERVPNPFTPNADGRNDFAQFKFPGLGDKPGAIYIYDVYDVLVKKIEVPAGAGSMEAARWYGDNQKGEPVPERVYLWVIEVDGRIVCEGTVSIAR